MPSPVPDGRNEPIAETPRIEWADHDVPALYARLGTTERVAHHIGCTPYDLSLHILLEGLQEQVDAARSEWVRAAHRELS